MSTAAGSETVVMVRPGGAIVKVKLMVAVCAGEPESVTLKVSGVALTAAVGVPPINPVEAFSVRPFGKVPLVNCQVYAPVPPVAESVCA